MMENSIFYAEELEQLPLTYYRMDKLNTKEVKELSDNLILGKSAKHFSMAYLVTYPIKPFSNYIIDEK